MLISQTQAIHMSMFYIGPYRKVPEFAQHPFVPLSPSFSVCLFVVLEIGPREYA